jgi:hypothetical protein
LHNAVSVRHSTRTEFAVAKVGMANAFLMLNEEWYADMSAVELNKQTGEPRDGSGNIVQRHKLCFVRPGKGELSPAYHETDRAAFTPAEICHNCAI